MVVADQVDRPVIRKVVESTFAKSVLTPQVEPLFTIHWEDGESLARRTRAPVILLATTLSGEGKTAELLRKMVSPQVSRGIAAGEFELFKRNDPWARRQLLIIVVGRDRRELGARMDDWADTLFSWAVEAERERLTTGLFHRGEQTALADDLRRRYGFRVRIQHDYIIAQENDSLDFIRLIRHGPERWIAVAWGVLPDSTLLTPRFIYQRRKRIGLAFADPVMLYDDQWSWELAELNGRRAILVRGLWSTIGPAGGGPFFSYGIWDEPTNKYYIIDGAVHAPGEAKMPYLWQLDAIAWTFTPAPGGIDEQ